MTTNNETFFLHAPSEEINARYVKEIEQYMAEPCPACTKNEALKLLKKFAKADWQSFWNQDITAYLPAVSEGTMKLCPVYRTHDDAIAYAKSLIQQLDPKTLARDFLYGTAHNAPEYRTALACYYYIKNLPEHTFERKYIGSHSKDVFSEVTCEICDYTCGQNPSVFHEPKMDFWHCNVDMEFYYFQACIPNHFSLNTAILFLEEYARQPRPDTSICDWEFFNAIVSVIVAAPENTTPASLRKLLKGGILKAMTNTQVEAFIDMLGYLNILHPQGAYGVTVRHTQQREMEQPHSMRTYFAYPVYNWNRKCGIDYDSINHLFGNLYE